MAVTKEVYALTAGFTPTDVLDQLELAFIDAGLMAGWHDTFTIGGYSYAVFECVYDPTKAFGTTYYLFVADTNRVGVAIGTGWDLATNEFTGTQFLDYYLQPPQIYNINNYRTTDLTAPMYYNNTSTLNIHRYTSTASVTQSWFVLQFGLSTSYPFAIIHPDQTFYPWLDLDLGNIPGIINVAAGPSSSCGAVNFYLQENIGRAYPYGQGVVGYTNTTNGSGIFHGMYKTMYGYLGTGKVPNYGTNNFNYGGNGTILPIASAAVNPAYAQDYVPICSELPWCSFSAAPLATDFGVYMHYANNTLNFEDRFVVDPGVEEWEILTYGNNPTVTTAASPTFIARVV